MSGLIDQIKATSGDPRSDRELTLLFGDQVAQSGRHDVFEKNPDFEREYRAIKDEIGRYNRPSLGEEFMGGLRSGGRELAAAGLGVGALAAGAVGLDSANQSLLAKAREEEEAAQEDRPSVPSLGDISGDHAISDTAYYFARNAGGLIPSLALGAAGSAAGALAGSAVEPGGGTIAGGIGGLIEGLTGDEAVQQIIAAAARQGTKMSLEDATALATKNLAKKIGSEAALAGTFGAQATGENYVRNPQTPGADIGFGAAAGILGAVAPGYVLGKFLPDGGSAAAEQAALGYWRRFVGEAAKTIPIGAGTTAASQLVDIAADKYAHGDDPSDFTQADLRSALNAGVVGGLGGALLAPFAAIPRRGGAGGDSAVAAATPEPAAPETTPAVSMPAPAGPSADQVTQRARASMQTFFPTAPSTAQESAGVFESSPAGQAGPYDQFHPEIQQYLQNATPPIDTAGLTPEVADAVTAAEDAASAVQGVPEAVAAADRAAALAQAGQPTQRAIQSLDTLAPPAGGPSPSTAAESASVFANQPGQDWAVTTPAEQPALRVPPGAADQVTQRARDSMRTFFSGQPSTAEESAQVLAALAPPKPIDPNWQFTIQSAKGDIPGFVQVDMLDGKGGSAGSTSPAKLIAQGYEMPDVSSLQQGQYKASDLLKQAPKPEAEAAVPVPAADEVVPAPVEKMVVAHPEEIGAPLPDNREAGLLPAKTAEVPAARAPEVPVPEEETPGIESLKVTGTPEAPAVIIPEAEGQTVTPIQSADSHVSQLADRAQMRAQKDFVLKAVADAAEDAPDAVRVSAAGQADYEKAQKIRDSFLEAAQGGKDDPKRKALETAAIQLAAKYGIDEADAMKVNTMTLAEQVQSRIRDQTGEKVTVEVPGDGTYRVLNSKDNLKAFGEIIEKRFGKSFSLPVQASGGRERATVQSPFGAKSETNKAPAAAAIPAVKRNPTDADIGKAVGMAASSDPTRWILAATYQDGGLTVATDGRRLFVGLGKAGVTAGQMLDADYAKQPASVRAKVAKKDWPGAKFPNWKQVVPDYIKVAANKITVTRDAPPAIIVDTAEALKALHQAAGVLSEKSQSVKLYLLPDGKLGVSGQSPDVGEYGSRGIDPETLDKAKPITALNPDFLHDALTAARMTGDEKVALYVKDDVSPAAIVGKKFVSVTMPVRLATRRVSSDYLAAPSSGVHLLDSVTKALAQDRGVAVVQLTKALGDAVGSAIKTTGLTMTEDSAKRIVAYVADNVHGVVNPDTVISLLHEAGHIFTADLPEAQREQFQQAIEQLPWTRQRWLDNPLSLDVRLLANADPDLLSSKQIEAMRRLSPQEIAQARATDPTVLASERMAEHLAQLGWDKQQATGLIDRLFRFVKDLWLRASMAIQSALKGQQNTSPELVRQFVENRFLQFINRDAATSRTRINSLLDWVGVPATTLERQPSFPAGHDVDTRTQFADKATGAMIPISYGAYTPDALRAFLQRSIDNAGRFVRDQQGRPTDPNVELTRRVNFSRPLPFDPTNTQNVALASINLEDEIYQGLRTDKEFALRLPTKKGVALSHSDFLTEMLRMPEEQIPEARKSAAIALAGQMTDPLTGKPVAYNPDVTVSGLPSYEETLIGKEKTPISVTLSEQQDEALKQTIFALRDTRRRMQSTFERENDRLNALIERRTEEKDEFPKESQEELDELQRSAPLRNDLITALGRQIDGLDSKFDPSMAVKVYPTAQYLRVPSSDADQEAILNNPKGTVPRDLNFATFAHKAILGQDLADMEAWLQNPANRMKGIIYGQIDETYRKLMQIPVNLQRANTAGLLRRTITNGLSDELRLSGMPALVNLGKQLNTVARIIGEHRVDAQKLGGRWDESFGNFAQAMGRAPDQTFREDTWDMLMRVWNHIDVSKRSEIGKSGPTAPIDLTAAAMNELAGFKIKSDAQRTALRDLMLSTIDVERWQMSVEKQNDIRVNDPTLGYERRLIPRGLAAGRRSIAKHMTGLYMRMNPDWAETAQVGPDDNRTFFQAAPDLYSEDRPTFDANIKRLFPSYVIKDFVEPLVYNNTEVFKAPTAPDNSTVRMASLLNVRRAWEAAEGDVRGFAEQLHRLEGGAAGDEGQTVGNVLAALRSKFYEIKADQDGRLGQEGAGREVLPRQIMDARLAHDWPAEWVSYGTYSPADNLTVLHQLALAGGLGKDALSGDSEIRLTIQEAKRDIAELWARHEELHQQGLSPKQIDRQMGETNAAIARRYWALTENLSGVTKALNAMTTNTGYLTGDFKAFNAAVGFLSGMMVQNPRSGFVNIIGDVQGPLAALKLSRPGVQAMFGSISSVARDMATSIVRAFGADVKFNTDLAHELYVNGASDPAQAVTWKQRQFNYGPNQSLSKPSGYEGPVSRAMRVMTKTAHQGREVLPNVGSPFDVGARPGDEAAAVAPKLRLGAFGTTMMSTMLANNRAGYSVFSDLAMRGVKYLNSLPADAREQVVRALELGTRDIEARQLGYNRGLILNDEAAFNYLKDAIETKLSGESSVGRFIAKAFRRQEAAAGGKWPILANSQFSDIINLTNSEWTLQNNFATLPPWMAGPLRPLFTFLTWPYQAMHRFGRTFTDPRGRVTWRGFNSTVADGMKTFFILAAPATIAGSFAIDLYDKYALGKKQNLREASLGTALPGIGAAVDPAAFMERIGRYGSAGFATDVLNRIVNYDTQRNLSLDDRIVAVSSLENLLNAVAVEPFQSQGNMTYATTVRPFLESIGAGGVLQYLQIANNLLGLKNEEAAINARINTNNYIRSTGRIMGMPVRVMSGPSEAPSPVSPYIHQMELAAIVDNPALFKSALRAARDVMVQKGRDENVADPQVYADRYIATNFSERHPLRRAFTTPPTETQYRQMLGMMGDLGAGQTRQAVNSYNRYLGTFFNKPAYYGRVDTAEPSIDQLLRQATRLSQAPDYDLAVGRHAY